MSSFEIAKIHQDGWKFVALFAAIAFVLYIISPILGFIGFTLTAWCAYFFRSPKRVTPTRDGLIISPADGLVSLISEVTPPADLNLGDGVRTRVSIFLNVFDVHVQRLPISGKIEKILYHPGKFVNAALDKASEDNERQTVVINNGAIKVAVTQIAGLIARRIRCDIKEGQDGQIGELYGLIRFGSRVDIYLPVGIHPQVILGQRTIGGETVIADMANNEQPRTGIKQ